jgi:hypothetical protein
VVSEINFKKWFDRMQPQTLQIATWLLYFDGFFALVDLLDGGGEMYYLRLRFPGGLLIGLVVIALYAGGGLLMANERRLGYRLSVAAAISPFLINFIVYSFRRRRILAVPTAWQRHHQFRVQRRPPCAAAPSAKQGAPANLVPLSLPHGFVGTSLDLPNCLHDHDHQEHRRTSLTHR